MIGKSENGAEEDLGVVLKEVGEAAQGSSWLCCGGGREELYLG